MKKIIKYLSLIMILIISIGLFMYKEQLNVLAEVNNLADVRLGDVFKNGTVIPYTEGIDYCALGDEYYCENLPDARSQYMWFMYYDENGNFLSAEEFNRYDENFDELKDIDAKINNDYSNYWLVEDFGHGCIAGFVFIPYDYKKPTFTLTCNPSSLKYNQYSTCFIKTKYYEKINSLNFTLDFNDFDITDINIGESFENLSVNNNIYSLDSKSSVVDSKEGTELTVITFRLNSKEDKNIDLENNIKVTNLNYIDKIENGQIDEVNTTLKQDIMTPSDEINTPNDEIQISTSEDAIPSNPKTGDETTFIIYGMLVTFVSVSLFLIINKKEEYEL